VFAVHLKHFPELDPVEAQFKPGAPVIEAQLGDVHAAQA
jgi:hypothetical protein